MVKMIPHLTEEGLIEEKINQRRRQILVHSRLYYVLDESYLEDRVFDQFAHELVNLQNKYPHIAKRCVFADAFSHFDGSTGFDLPLDDPWVEYKARQLLQMHKDRKGGKI